MNSSEIILAALRSEICGNNEYDNIKKAFSSSNDTSLLLEEIYRITKHHDVAHIVCSALEKAKLLENDAISEKLKKDYFLAFLRYERINHDFKMICELLSDAAIDFMPLKGSVIRKYYREPWMRTSCDIDILIHEDDLDKAIDSLSAVSGFEKGIKAGHDVSFMTPSGISLELHYNLVDDTGFEEGKDVLSDIWNKSFLVQKSEHHFVMSDEMFYFYHIIHMAKHFENGGCGVRTFIDLWILNHNMEYDKEKRDELLQKGGMLKFARACEALSEVWFSELGHSEITRWLESYIWYSGAYGTRANSVAISQAEKGGKLSHIRSRIFLPYDEIKYYYLILQKHKWLTPFYEVRRWFRLLRLKTAKRAVREIKMGNDVTEAQNAKNKAMLKELGL